MWNKSLLLIMLLLTACATDIPKYKEHPDGDGYIYVRDKTLFEVIKEGYKYQDGEWKSKERIAHEEEDKLWLSTYDPANDIKLCPDTLLQEYIPSDNGGEQK